MTLRLWAACAALLFLLTPQMATRPAFGSGRPCIGVRDVDAKLLCLRAAADEMSAALASARSRAVKAIQEWDGNLTEDDRQQWQAGFGDTFYLWLALRDRFCDPRLLGFERRLEQKEAAVAAWECRLATGGVIVADLTHRFGGASGAARRSFAEPGRGPNRRDVIAAEGTQPLCRHPGRGGDYQPLTACFERHAARLNRDLAATFESVRSTIRARSGLTSTERAEWLNLATSVQDGWRDLRDKACPMEAFETPNRFANSIHSSIVGPCLVVETEARIRQLRSAYAVR